MIVPGSSSEGLSHTEKLNIYKNNLEKLTKDLGKGNEIEFQKVKELVENINGLLDLKLLEKEESSNIERQLGKFYVDYLIPSLRTIDNSFALSVAALKVAETLTDPVWSSTATAILDPESRLMDPESRLMDPESRLMDPESRLMDPESRLICDWTWVNKEEDFHGS